MSIKQFSNVFSFSSKIAAAKQRYEENGEIVTYLADSAVIALYAVATNLALEDARYRTLPGLVSAAQYPIRAAASMAAERLDCPVECEHSAESFARHFLSHIKDEVGNDVETVRSLLGQLGIALVR